MGNCRDPEANFGLAHTSITKQLKHYFQKKKKKKKLKCKKSQVEDKSYAATQ